MCAAWSSTGSWWSVYLPPYFCFHICYSSSSDITGGTCLGKHSQWLYLPRTEWIWHSLQWETVPCNYIFLLGLVCTHLITATTEPSMSNASEEGYLLCIRLICLLVQGQDKMKWSFTLKACCSLNEDTDFLISYVSWVLANVTTQSSCWSCKCDRNSGHRHLYNGLSKIWDRLL
jgi:hypothetical protein